MRIGLWLYEQQKKYCEEGKNWRQCKKKDCPLGQIECVVIPGVNLKLMTLCEYFHTLGEKKLITDLELRNAGIYG
jgi:hypothetical protein